jgi:hypothetical protein
MAFAANNFCVTLCVTRLGKNGQIPDDVRRCRFQCNLAGKRKLRSLDDC